jgi:hypothetical protein
MLNQQIIFLHSQHGQTISRETTATKNRIFVSFAMEDKKYRDFLVGQAKNERSPFEFVNMSCLSLGIRSGRATAARVSKVVTE